MINRRIIYGACLVLLALGVQLPAIQRPFLGHYASYQATVMASISRNMIRENFSEFLLPQTDSIIGGKRSLHLNQYPFPSLVAALGVKGFGGTLEFWGRFQAIVCNLLSILLLGVIVRKLFDEKTAWISASIFALSPMTLIYGQAFMSESMSLFFLLLSLFLILKIGKAKSSYDGLILAGFSFGIAVTGRIHFILFFPVYFLYLLLNASNQKPLKAIIFGLCALAMPVAWYAYTYFTGLHAANIHTNIFLQMSSQKPDAWKLIFHFDYWRKVFDTISQMMLTPLLFPFLFLGVVLMRRKGNGFWLSVGGTILGAFAILLAPEKVMRHDFYLYGLVPFVVIIVSCGIAAIAGAFPALKTWRSIAVFLLLYFCISSRFFLHPIFSAPANEQNVLRVGQIIQAETKRDDLLIVFGDNPGTMLYYADRAGWALEPNLVGKPLSAYQKNIQLESTVLAEADQLEKAMKSPITWFEHLHQQGAAYLVASNRKELESLSELFHYLKERFQMVSAEKDDFYLFKLPLKS